MGNPGLMFLADGAKAFGIWRSPMEDAFAFEIHGKRVKMVRTPGTLGKQHAQGRFYEGQMLDYIASLKLSGRYLDIGANIGNHAVFFDMFCDSTHVDAFEPQEYMHPIFDGNVSLNELTKTTLHKCGLGQKREVVTVPFGSRSITFECLTLDSFGFDDVAVVKMDIEGMEPACVAGAVETLERCSPVLFIEANSDRDIEDQSSVLTPLGYRRTGRVWNPSPTYEWKKA